MIKKLLANKYQYDDLLVRSQDPYANAKYEVILKWLKARNISTILNAGCGSGELSFILAANGYSVTSFDLDKDYIDLAKKKLKKTNFKNCTFFVSGIEDFISKTKYDAMIATDVLEHIEDDAGAFKKLISFIRSGGTVVITVPAGQYLFGFHDEQLGHFRRYSKPGFIKIIPKSIEVKHIRYFGFFLIPIAFLISKVIKKSYPIAKSNIMSRFIFRVEKKFAFPLGTGILFCGIKRKIGAF